MDLGHQNGGFAPARCDCHPPGLAGRHPEAGCSPQGRRVRSVRCRSLQKDPGDGLRHRDGRPRSNDSTTCRFVRHTCCAPPLFTQLQHAVQAVGPGMSWEIQPARTQCHGSSMRPLGTGTHSGVGKKYMTARCSRSPSTLEGSMTGSAMSITSKGLTMPPLYSAREKYEQRCQY